MTINDIVQRIYKNTKSNSFSYDAPTMLIDINVAFNRVVSLINASDDRWQWDDTNNTDLPIATTTLNPNFPIIQQDYTLSTAFLTIDRVEITDLTGNTTELTPFDQHDIKNTALTNYKKTPGVPTQYDKFGSSVTLYPPPNYTLAAGLKVYFTRGPNEFTSVDVTAGTKQPGFNSLFHDLIPLWVSYDYWLVNDQSLCSGYLGEIQRKEQDLIDFYGGRSRDERPRLTVATNRNNGRWGNTSGQLNGYGGDSNK